MMEQGRSPRRQIMFELGYIRSTTDQILAEVRRPSEPPAGMKSMAISFGQTVMRALLPHMTPYIIALAGMIGAAVIGLWKAISRGWLSGWFT